MDIHLETMKNKKYDAKWLIRKFSEGYSRCLYIDTGIGEREKYEACAKGITKELKLRYESRDGTLSMVSDAIKNTKTLASRKMSEPFR